MSSVAILAASFVLVSCLPLSEPTISLRLPCLPVDQAGSEQNFQGLETFQITPFLQHVQIWHALSISAFCLGCAVSCFGDDV